MRSLDTLTHPVANPQVDVDDGGLGRVAPGEAGFDANALLDNNDGYSFFEAVDGLIKTGPTLTNVNDFRAVLVMP